MAGATTPSHARLGVTDLVLVPLIVATASGPLACRLLGLGAVVLERVRTGSWSHYHEAQSKYAIMRWIQESNFDSRAWLIAFASPFLLAVWLLIKRGTARSTERLCRMFQVLAATWTIGFGGAWLLMVVT